MNEYIGINLGSLNIRVAVYRNGLPELIPMDVEHGDTKIPAVISFRKGKQIIGSQALDRPPKNTVFALKVWTEDIFTYSEFADIVEGCYSLKTSADGSERLCHRQEIVARILGAIREQILLAGVAETSLKKVVFTIPDFATQNHRKMLLQAAKIADFKEIHFLNHSTAAAIYYNFETTPVDRHYFLVLHYGGYSASVSLYLKHPGIDGNLELIAAAGDTGSVGGEMITMELQNHYEEQIEGRLKEKGILNADDRKQIRDVCEKAKIQLSTAKDALLSFDIDNEDILFTLTREEFERSIMKEHRSKIEKFLEQVLTPLSQTNPTQPVENIVFVGGSTRISVLPEILADYIENPNFMTQINPDVAVAFGAAIKCAILSGDLKVKNYHITNIPMRPIYCDFEYEYVSTELIQDNSPKFETQKEKIIISPKLNEKEKLPQNSLASRKKVKKGSRKIVKENSVDKPATVIANRVNTVKGSVTVANNIERAIPFMSRDFFRIDKASSDVKVTFYDDDKTLPLLIADIPTFGMTLSSSINENGIVSIWTKFHGNGKRVEKETNILDSYECFNLNRSFLTSSLQIEEIKMRIAGKFVEKNIKIESEEKSEEIQKKKIKNNRKKKSDKSVFELSSNDEEIKEIKFINGNVKSSKKQKAKHVDGQPTSSNFWRDEAHQVVKNLAELPEHYFDIDVENRTAMKNPVFGFDSLRVPIFSEKMEERSENFHTFSTKLQPKNLKDALQLPSSSNKISPKNRKAPEPRSSSTSPSILSISPTDVNVDTKKFLQKETPMNKIKDTPTKSKTQAGKKIAKKRNRKSSASSITSNPKVNKRVKKQKRDS